MDAFYNEMFKNFDFNGIKFGDRISGVSRDGIKFTGELTTVGGGTLGIFFNDVPIEFYPENGGDVMIKETIKKS